MSPAGDTASAPVLSSVHYRALHSALCIQRVRQAGRQAGRQGGGVPLSVRPAGMDTEILLQPTPEREREREREHKSSLSGQPTIWFHI